MTPEAAVYRFLSGFGVPAYASTSVPDQAEFPYLTYTLVVGEWGDGGVSMQVDLWYRTESEAVPNAKVREISRHIGIGGTTVPCDDGMLWIRRGSPWAQAVDIAEEDDEVKRRYINLIIEYLIPE